LEDLVEDKSIILSHIKQQIEEGTAANSEAQKYSLNTEISEATSKLKEVSENLKVETETKDKLVGDIVKLRTEEGELEQRNSNLESDINAENISYMKMLQNVEDVQERKRLLDENVESLIEKQDSLIRENTNIEKGIKELDKDINHKKGIIEENDLTINKGKAGIANLNQEINELKAGNKEIIEKKCKEQYTFWNLDFISNNKTSFFSTILTAVVVGACLPFLIKSIPPTETSSGNASFKNNTFKETSPSRLEHMSDDEDNSEMVPSSSVLPKRDLKYNYDRDCMEKNENPSGCLDYIREKYGIKMNLHKCWETLKECESIEINLWNIKNDELILTKLLLKKIFKAKKPLLTFELFQTKLRDGFPHSDFEEIELDEQDNRIEANLALQIYHGLPEFSV